MTRMHSLFIFVLLLFVNGLGGLSVNRLNEHEQNEETEESSARKMEMQSGFDEGDMVLTPQQKQSLYSDTNTYGSIKQRYTWPSTTIPYVIDSSLTSEPKALKEIKQAFEEYRKHTCIRFVERTTEHAYIRMYNGYGCHSPVGYRGDVNQISLAWKCWWRGTIVHELAHSLGFFHEQSRADRDSYVRIHWENVPKMLENNFEKQTKDSVDSLGTKYDYLSIMHYGGRAFGGKKMTIEALDPCYQRKMGQRMGFSAIDIVQMNLLYKCSSPPPQSTTSQPPKTASQTTKKVETREPKTQVTQKPSTQKPSTQSPPRRCQDAFPWKCRSRNSCKEWRDFCHKTCNVC